MNNKRVDRAVGADMYGKTVMHRPASTMLRANKYGAANQLAHKQEGERQRAEFAAQMAARKTERGEAMRKESAKARGQTGMNAGTMGRSRVSK